MALILVIKSTLRYVECLPRHIPQTTITMLYENEESCLTIFSEQLKCSQCQGLDHSILGLEKIHNWRQSTQLPNNSL